MKHINSLRRLLVTKSNTLKRTDSHLRFLRDFEADWNTHVKPTGSKQHLLTIL